MEKYNQAASYYNQLASAYSSLFNSMSSSDSMAVTSVSGVNVHDLNYRIQVWLVDWPSVNESSKWAQASLKLQNCVGNLGNASQILENVTGIGVESAREQLRPYLTNGKLSYMVAFEQSYPGARP